MPYKFLGIEKRLSKYKTTHPEIQTNHTINPVQYSNTHSDK